MPTTDVELREPIQGAVMVTEFDRRRLLGLIELLRSRHADTASLEALELELELAETVDPRAVPPDVVTMNSKVQLLDLDTNDHLTLAVVFPGAADAAAGRVSVLAPIGLALLGARAGSVVEWPTPARQRRLKVERVCFQPEASGNFEL